MTRIYVPDIECDSCVRLITKKLGHIKGLKVNKDSVDVPDASKIEASRIISGLGYRNATEPFERKTFSERIRHVRENKVKYELEFTGLKYALVTFVILIALFAVAYLTFLKDIPRFSSNYALWLFYLVISVTALSLALWHFFAYKTKVTHMVGMMVGITFGMQTGMMLGTIIGATNGFFIGAMVGMLGGVLVGILTGKCCGVMGTMEGMMAGLMGGTMGPMISLMMLNDNLHLFMPFYMLVNLLILGGLSYMFYEEVVETSRPEKNPIGFGTYITACIIVSIALSLLMIYGPKSALFG